MADRIGSTVGTTHQAADVLAQLAGTGKIASSNLEEVGRSVLSFSKATGTAIEDVVSQFTKLSADPAKASAELNKELHYLTASTYAQIKALQDQGNATAAQSLAEQTLAKAFDERAKALTDRLGYIESGWRKVKGIASEAWDAMLNVGREDTLQKQIAQIEKDLSAPSSTSYVDSLITGRQVMDDKRKADLQLQLSFLKQQLSTEEAISKAQQQKNEHTEKQIAAQQRLDNQLKETASNQQKLADKLKQIDTDAALNPGKYTEAQIKQLKDAAAAQYADRDAINAANKARREAEVAAKRQAEAEQRVLDALLPQQAAQKAHSEQLAILDKRYNSGTLSLEDYQTAVENAWNALNKVEFDKKAKEAEELEKALKGNEEAFHSLEERLDPTIKASRDYANNQEILNKALANGQVSTTEYTRLMGLLGTEYTKSQRGVDQWAEFTEGAVDRVDEAFANSWANITDGFGGFAKNLKNAFLQLLGELAHLAITRPIVMQIGAALGVGGLSGAVNASGLFGSGAGGFSLDSLYSMGTGAYKFLTGTGSQALSAFQTGGFGGLLDMGKGALSGLFSSGTGSTAAGYANVSNFMATPTGSVNGLFGSGLSAGATGLAGLGGALYGYGKAGLKGAATGGAGAVGGALLGNMLLPGIGGIVGSALGGFLGGSLFGGKWQTKDVGLSLGVSGGDLDAQQYEYQKKKGGLFGSNKKRTRYSDLDDATQSALDATFDNLASTSQDIFTMLGIQVGDGALDGLNIAATKISTKDKSEEEIQQAISDWFTGVGDQMVTAINDATGQKLSGVVINGGLNLTGVAELANNLYIINDILDSLRLTSQALTVDGALANQALMNLAGGMDALKANTSTYYQNFFSEAERNQDTVDAVRKQFEALNVVLPDTRDGYRQMVEALDLTTAYGQDMFTKLTALAGTAATAYTILEAQAAAAQQAAQEAAAAAQQALMTGVNDAFSALQAGVQKQQQAITEAYNAQITSLNDMLSTSQSNIQGLTSVSNSLKNALKQLTGQSDDAVKTLRAQAQATLQSALSTARAGGSLAGFDLSDALSTVAESSSDLYSSYEDMARDQGRTANVVAELNGYADKRLTVEQQTLAKLQTQIDTAKAGYEAESARLDAIVDHAQAQIDALNGINNGVQTLAQLIASMSGAVSAAAPTGTGSTNSTNLIESAYQAVLGRSAEAAGMAYWQAQLASGAVTSANLLQAIRAGAAPGEKVSAFASGGIHSGGLRLVGENGPELEVTGPSRIYNNADTMKMLGGGSSELIAEVRALRAQVDTLNQHARSINDNTGFTRQDVRVIRDLA